jgi:hypothetical protein
MVRKGSGVQIPATAPFLFVLMIERYPIAVADLDDREAGLVHDKYWLGHTIGRGETHPVPDIRTSRIALAIADLRLTRFGLLADDFYPTHSFLHGRTFDAGDHPDGTIVRIEEEHLVTAVAYEPIDVENFAGVRPAVRERIEDGDTIVATGDHFDYVHTINVGVVGRTLWRRQPTLHKYASTVIRPSADEVALNVGLSPAPPVLDVGTVNHYSSDSGRDVLLRYHRVDVLQEGLITGARATVIPLGPGPRPQPAM